MTDPDGTDIYEEHWEEPRGEPPSAVNASTGVSTTGRSSASVAVSMPVGSEVLSVLTSLFWEVTQ